MKSNGFEELKDKIDNLDGISKERKDILRHTNFVDDYINYVLMNMQKMYPQIAWKGLYH